jgi:hypothetical protein
MGAMCLDEVEGDGLPPELLNDDPNGFAWGVWHDRTPKLVAQLRDSYPYGPAQRDAFDALLDEIAAGPMRPLPDDAHDHDLWAVWGRGHFGRTWLEAPFLWSEAYSSGGCWRRAGSSARGRGRALIPSPG